jgi:glutaredoxin-related protein
VAVVCPVVECSHSSQDKPCCDLWEDHCIIAESTNQTRPLAQTPSPQQVRHPRTNAMLAGRSSRLLCRQLLRTSPIAAAAPSHQQAAQQQAAAVWNAGRITTSSVRFFAANGVDSHNKENPPQPEPQQQQQESGSHSDFAPQRKSVVSDEDQAIALIQKHITENPIMLYMKGMPAMPMCGFSAKVVKILKDEGADFSSVNVLDYPAIRDGVKKFSDWPTMYVHHKHILQRLGILFYTNNGLLLDISDPNFTSMANSLVGATLSRPCTNRASSRNYCKR